MSDIDIDAIEGRAAAATPGPWAYEGVSEKANDYRVGVVCPVTDNSEVLAQIGGNVQSHPHYYNTETDEFGEWYCEEIAMLDDCSHTSDGGCGSDAAFIAHAREDIPVLIAALRERDKRIAELEEALEPFARLAGQYDNDPNWMPNACPVRANTDLHQISFMSPTVGDHPAPVQHWSKTMAEGQSPETEADWQAGYMRLLEKLRTAEHERDEALRKQLRFMVDNALAAGVPEPFLQWAICWADEADERVAYSVRYDDQEIVITVGDLRALAALGETDG